MCARAGNFMREYWHRPEQTEPAFAGGWYHTGDAGDLDDPDTRSWPLTDRVKDMIVSGGESVYSAEVENVIAGYPGVAHVAVIAVPSEKWGEAVHAIVVMAPDANAGEDGIKTSCGDRLKVVRRPLEGREAGVRPPTGRARNARSADQPALWGFTPLWGLD